MSVAMPSCCVQRAESINCVVKLHIQRTYKMWTPLRLHFCIKCQTDQQNVDMDSVPLFDVVSMCLPRWRKDCHVNKKHISKLHEDAGLPFGTRNP